MLSSKILYFARSIHASAKVFSAPGIKKAFDSIHVDPSNAITSIAWNIVDTLKLSETTSTYLAGTLEYIADNPRVLTPAVLGALQVLTNETARLLTTRRYINGRGVIFYPKLLDKHLIPFAETHFRHNKISLSLKNRLSDPDQMLIVFYERTPFCSNYFGPYYHSEVLECTLDPKVKKFAEFEACMSDYVRFYSFRIVHDLVRESFKTYPSNLAYFNEQLRIIELMFSKTALSAEESQKLLRGALNAALYGSEDYAHVEETVLRIQEDKHSVSEGLKQISSDIKHHGRKYGFGVTESFVPNVADFVIHTSFKDRVLNSMRTDLGKGE